MTLRALPGVAAPAWALALVRSVCAAEGVRRPTVLWTGTTTLQDAAAWVNGEIMRVSAPRRATRTTRLLLLHEVAHLTAGIPHGHARAWGDEYRRLVATYGGTEAG